MIYVDLIRVKTNMGRQELYDRATQADIHGPSGPNYYTSYGD